MNTAVMPLAECAPLLGGIQAPVAYLAEMAADDTASDQVGIPAVTDACAERWSEHTGLDRAALDQCMTDPEREILERPPRWTGLTPSPEQRFLLAGGGEACFVLVESEAPGNAYTAITCVIRNRSELARRLPAPAARRGRRLLLPIALVVLGVVVLAGIGVGVYALVNKSSGGSSKPAAPRPARALVAASFASVRAPQLRGASLGRPRLVHRARGNRPREVCAPVRRRGRPAGHWCVEIAGGRVVSSWLVPRGRADRARFRRLCTGQAKAQGRCG